MDLSLEVRPGMNRYVSGSAVLKELPQYLTQFKKIVVITGKKSFAVFESYYQKSLPYPIYHYDESASYEDGKRLAKEIETADCILGIGGGKLLDTAKIVADILQAEFISIPTLISNCAPFTPLAAVYHPDHSFNELGYFKKGGYLIIVDWEFLLQTPREYLIAGIGDTLAKWYESQGAMKKLLPEEKTAFISLGEASAKTVLNILLTDSETAISALEKNEVTPAFGRIADTIIGLASEVGGFAAEYGRIAGAHAIHNGLSYLPETHAILHGKKVAYGILVQLAYTKEYEEITKLIPFYQKIGLPISLKELNVSDTSLAHLKPFVDFSSSKKESFQLIDANCSSEKIYQAIEKLEEITTPHVGNLH